jgi:voltage-gated potassium channel
MTAVRDRIPGVGRANIVERSMTRFLREPPSVRRAAGVIVTVTAAVVVGGGVLMRIFDHTEYSNIWVGMWWALQTVTTVGYGDVTPTRASGRIIAAFVMLEGVAFVTIVIAAITSTFVARAAKDRGVPDPAAPVAVEGQIEAQLTAIEERLARLERLLEK